MTVDHVALNAGKPLLSPMESNPKIAKGKGLGYLGAILHLSPFNKSGHMNCSHASPACVIGCLDTAGHGGIGGPDNTVQRARIRKSQWFHQDNATFMARLVKELESLVVKAATHGLKPAMRLNGTSDLGFHKKPCYRGKQLFRNVFEAFPEITFYDYSKVPTRVLLNDIIQNYRVTFSLSECNDAHARAILDAGHNVAAVFRIGKHDPMPQLWSGFSVVDGTTHDFRFLDPQKDGLRPSHGVIVGLRPKGKAIQDTSGWVRDLDGELDTTRVNVLAASSLGKAAA